jgi:DNA (cytosine-5)-methyltransferase 1
MLRIIELFAGIGAWSVALQRLKIPYKLLGFAEIDKYAIKAYGAIHNVDSSLNLGNVNEITHLPPEIDIMFASPPCQEFSNANTRKKGFESERGNLFFETLRLITISKPKVVIIENVKGLLNKKWSPKLEYAFSYLRGLGYFVDYRVLQAKDFNIPQSRARVFIVCIRNDVYKGDFKFPTPVPLTRFLIDMLDENVDEKYYITSEKWIERINKDLAIKKWSSIDPEIARCQLSNQYANSRGNFVSDKLTRIAHINGKTAQGNRVYAPGISACLAANAGGWAGKTESYEINGRIRKLTPCEALKLMGFDISHYEKLKSAEMSDNQIYKLSGNSIVVDVIVALLSCILKAVDF